MSERHSRKLWSIRRIISYCRWLILWPWNAVLDQCGFVGDAVAERSAKLEKASSTGRVPQIPTASSFGPIRKLARFVSVVVCLPFSVLRYLVQLVNKGLKRRAFGVIGAIVSFPFRELFYLVGLIRDDLDGRRSYRIYLRSVPALAAGVMAIAAVVGTYAVRIRSDEVAYYQGHAERALEARELPKAQLCFGRLLDADGANPAWSYGLALAAEASGEDARCRIMMDRLAPASRAGYGPAHGWQARRLLANEPIVVSDVYRAQAQLLRALKDDPENLDLNLLLAKVLLNTNQARDAERILAPIIARRPEFRLLLAQLYAARGAKKEARAAARVARDYFAGRVSANPHDAQNRLRWAESFALLDDYAAAANAIEQGLSLDDSPALHTALAEVYVAWSDARLDGPGRTAAERVGLIDRALAENPWNISAVRKLLLLAKGPDAEAKPALALLAKLENADGMPAQMHFMFGTDYWNAGKSEQARRHFEAAYQLEPTAAANANNFAWALAHSEPLDLAGALKIINAALKSTPGQLNLLDTRGRILAKMDRWQDARLDFEQLAKTRSNDPAIHRTLAECYARLGMNAMAEVYGGQPASDPALPQLGSESGQTPN
jgi:predicted Zn-dependent protease